MLKLYFKKLLLGLLIPVLILIVYLMGFNILYTFANFFEEESVIWQIVLFGMPTAIVFIIVYFMRVNNRKNRTQYMIDFTNNKKYSFLKDLAYIAKSRDYICEILACVTVCLPIAIVMGIELGVIFVPLVLGSLSLTVISLIIFSIIDIPMWILVHKRWTKD